MRSVVDRNVVMRPIPAFTFRRGGVQAPNVTGGSTLPPNPIHTLSFVKNLLLVCNTGASTILVESVVMFVGGRSVLSQISALAQDMMVVSSSTSSHFMYKALSE